jgi:hypothetical protein
LGPYEVPLKPSQQKSISSTMQIGTVMFGSIVPKMILAIRVFNAESLVSILRNVAIPINSCCRIMNIVD